MKELKNILVPVDFKQSSEEAFMYAASVARIFNSRILLLHVISESSLSSETEALILESVELKFKKLTERVGEDIRNRIERIVEWGVVFERIGHTAIVQDVNVVIAGSGNGSGDDRYQLGTNVEKLMRKNQVPLWIVKNGTRFPVKKILCPVDFSDASERALHNAILLALRLQSNLTIMHVWSKIDSYSPRLQHEVAEENQVRRIKTEKDFDDFLKRFDFQGMPYQKLFLEGVAHQEILSVTETKEFDLLVMGTTGRTGLNRILMGSTTEKVTRELPCSFITTKSQDIARTVFESNLNEIETFLKKANQYRGMGEYGKAIDYYLLGLKQYPDNIPILINLKETYHLIGDGIKSKFYRDYAKEAVMRIWGIEYLEKFGLDQEN
jgi:nucleotide-binding universal stress UspA family protein